jgi:very-short-patch-repair endonuclease
VIALGIKHAERIDTALRAALAGLGESGSEQGLEAFFGEDVPEPFFVKNLERVQGDERDAIILSIGYGKHPDGRMRYQWGPLLRDGGERRLNVAATRAKHRLTLVSSFSGHDVDPDRVTKAGARMLAEYLDYASSGGSARPASGAAEVDPFEADVRERLAEAGITVVPQYGVGGYRVDFAATHPSDPARMVLAIEADGASYWQSGSVRDRDRLRGEHLQRLGWRYHRLWSTNWFRNPDDEVAKVREAYQRAVSAAEAGESRPEREAPPSAANPRPAAGHGQQESGPARPEEPQVRQPQQNKPNGPQPGQPSLPEASLPRLPEASLPGRQEAGLHSPFQAAQPGSGRIELGAGPTPARAAMWAGTGVPEAGLPAGDPVRAGLPAGNPRRALDSQPSLDAGES